MFTIDKKELNNSVNNELSLNDIIECTFYRFFEKPYGICDIVRAVLKAGGKLRIHSGDTQIIITKRFLSIFENSKTAIELSANLTDCLVNNKDYNYKEGLKFQGTHIEIEMPIEIRRRTSDSV